MKPGKKLPGTPEPMHRWKGAGEVTIAADSWGDPGSPLVILLHGGGQTRHSWRAVGRILGRSGYHAVTFDARGHGDSDWAPDGRYDLDAMIADLKSVIVALDNRRSVLVGASMGGGVSLAAVGENRVDAAGLILVDIAPRIEMQGADRIAQFMSQKPEGFESLEEVAEAISAYQPHRKRPRNLAGLAKNVRIAADGRYRWHWDPRFRRGKVELQKRQERFEACARNLRLPTLLVRGGLSDVLTEQGAQEFLQLCSHAEYVNVKEAAHMVAGDRNDVFGSAVIEFLVRTIHHDRPSD
jgi:non-heme chloroperoxidase